MNFVEVVKTYGYPIISKEIAAAVDGARKGQQSRIDSFNGGIIRGNGKKYRDYSRYKYLLDAPFKISAYCCDVMKKHQHMHILPKQRVNPLLVHLLLKVI